MLEASNFSSQRLQKLTAFFLKHEGMAKVCGQVVIWALSFATTSTSRSKGKDPQLASLRRASVPHITAAIKNILNFSFSLQPQL